MEGIAISHTIKPTFTLLKFTFGLVPIIAGMDKFTNLLTDWTKYVHPTLVDMLPVSPHVFMMIVGVIEMMAGIIVLTKTETGGYIVAAWLTVIALTLLPGMQFIDVAVRDLVMAIAAFAMARMAKFVNYYNNLT